MTRRNDVYHNATQAVAVWDVGKGKWWVSVGHRNRTKKTWPSETAARNAMELRRRDGDYHIPEEYDLVTADFRTRKFKVKRIRKRVPVGQRPINESI